MTNIKNTVYVNIFKIKELYISFKNEQRRGQVLKVYKRKIKTKRKEQEGNSNGMFLVSAIPIV